MCSNSNMAEYFPEKLNAFEFPCQILDVINIHPESPPSSFPQQHSENAGFRLHLLFLHACSKKGDQEVKMSEEGHFPYDNLGQEFTSCLKFIQDSLVCPFLHPTYPQHF